jgi:hypothetical protein
LSPGPEGGFPESHTKEAIDFPERTAMHASGNGDDIDDEIKDVDDARAGDVVLDTEAEVACPHCGETIVMGLDPGGGRTQEYVEDCQVCCRPCRVRVSYDETGAAEVWVEEAQ